MEVLANAWLQLFPTEQLALILRGVFATLAISIFSFLLGLAIGLPLAFVRTYMGKPFQLVVDVYEKVLRGIPELVLILFIYLGVGLSLGFTPLQNAFTAATFSLGLRSGAHQSQIFRGAIRGIGGEQMVAARALGLSRLRAIFYVMVPQTFVVATAGLGSEYSLLVKDSSLAFIIGVRDIMFWADRVRAITLDMVFPTLAAAFLYIVLTFPLATYLDVWGSRKKKHLGL
ncbi:MAG: ABC transporter permease subunit [Candidatus Thorarchaeota archaeon]|nr:ABC transporter permease subunit [Candidatus Thorarchaeota archaeon]